MTMTTMTSARLVEFANALATMSFTPRAAVLTALKEPCLDTITRAVRTNPDLVGRFVDLMFDGPDPVLAEAAMWAEVVAMVEAETNAEEAR